MSGHEAARRLSDLDAVRQLLVRAARDAYALGEVFAVPSPIKDETARRRRELLAQLARGIADGVVDALDAVNEMADALARPRQGGA